MKYMLLIYANQEALPQSTPEEFKAARAEWSSLEDELRAEGILIANHGLAPVSDATTVRIRDGKTLIADGPFAETHEQLGGYYLIDCKDLDEALGWAKRIPLAKYGTIEVRPLNIYSQ